MIADRILVCGSRKWNDEEIVYTILEGFYQEGMTIIDGVAAGADTYGYTWAQLHEGFVISERYPADWDQYGKRAGFIRNSQMLKEGKPNLVLAFTDNLAESKGTAMMVKLAKDAGVPTYVIGRG